MDRQSGDLVSLVRVGRHMENALAQVTWRLPAVGRAFVGGIKADRGLLLGIPLSSSAPASLQSYHPPSSGVIRIIDCAVGAV